MAAPQPDTAPSDRVEDPAGWVASLDLGFARRGGRTVLAERRQRGPLVVQRPFYPEGAPCHVYVLHPPGGVAGGDRLDIDVQVAAGAHALITTPGATKFYRSSGPRAQVRQRIRVEAGGVLEWLPQEGILFPGARIRVDTEIDLRGDARLFSWDVQALGRPACSERFTQGQADLAFALYRDGHPLLVERLRLGGASDLMGRSGLRGLPVCAALVAGPAVPADLEAARGAARAADVPVLGITLVDGMLVARCLAEAVEPVRQAYRGLWWLLRPRLLGLAPCPPRIWST
jgi:urease accessory protein